MKRGLSFLSIMVIVLGVSYARTVGVSLSYSPNMEFPQRLVEAVSYKEGPWCFDMVEHGGRKTDVSVQYNPKTSSILAHRVLANTSYSYGLCGWSGLGYMLGVEYRRGLLELGLDIGVQFAVAYGPYFEDVLFSITPLARAVVGVASAGFEANAYMSFTTPFGREWKAVPTVGGKVAIGVLDPYWIGTEAFVKYAEFLTDTRTMVSAFGIRLSCEYRTGGCR